MQIRLSPGIVIATHMEAQNHCPVMRARFPEAVVREGLTHKVRVPMDDESVVL